MSWVVLMVLQTLSLLPFIAWLTLASPIYIIIVLMGCFLYQTNLLASTAFWNAWFFLYSGRKDIFNKLNIIQYDTELLNDSMIVHLFLASIPHAIVKIYNNSLIPQEDKTAAYWLSVAMSLIYIAIGLYRYTYLAFAEKTTFSKVPFMSNSSIQIFGENALIGIPNGAYDVRRNKEVREQDAIRWKKLLHQYEVEEVLALSESIIVKCFLNESEFIRVSSIIGSDDGNTNEKLMIKCQEELSNILRLSKIRHTSAHDLASRALMLIKRDSIDNKLYKYFKAQGITCASDLINCSPSIVDKIINSMNKNCTKKVVTAYLKLIALNRVEGIRDSIAAFVGSMIVMPGIGNIDADHQAGLYRYNSYTTETQSQNSINISHRTVDDLDNHQNNVICLENGKMIDSSADDQVQMNPSDKSGDGTFTWRTMPSSKTANNNADYSTISDPMNTSIAVDLSVDDAIESAPSSEKSDSSVLGMIWRNISSQKL